MDISRRSFVGGALAFGAWGTCEALGGSQLAATAAGAINCAPPVTRKIVAPGFAYPEACADLPGECLFTPEELPVGKPVRFTVTPRDCFGRAGRPLIKEVTCS